MSELTREDSIKLAEYAHAQDMLKHYDNLNWQIGSILIGANAVLLGLVADAIPKIEPRAGWWAMGIAIAVPVFSFGLLTAWRMWFLRHRDLYNLRNETLHRIETELGMYHFLRVVQAENKLQFEDPATIAEAPAVARLRQLRDEAYSVRGQTFTPFYPRRTLGGIGGERVTKWLSRGIPIAECAVLVSLVAILN